MFRKLLALTFITFLMFLPNANAAISGVSLVDSDLFYPSGKIWIIDWGSQYSDYITSTLNPSDFKEETGYASENSFTLKMTSADEYATYGLNYFKPVSKIELIKSPFVWWGWSDADRDDWIARNCWDADMNGIAEWAGKTNPLWGLQQLFCVKRKELLGAVYSIGTPKGIFSTDWEFKAEGKPIEIFSLSNDNNVEDGLTTSINNVAKIRWKGSLSTGTIPPVATLMYSSKDVYGNWNLVDSSTYDAYDRALDNDLVDDVTDWANGVVAKETVENDFNAKASMVMSRWTSKPEFKKNVIDFNADRFDLDLEEKVFIPTFQILLDGKYYVKVVIPYGMPEISSLTLPKLTEDYEGSAFVAVKNAGNDVADFEVWLTCEPSEKFTVSPYKQILSHVKPKDTDTLTFDIIIADVDKEGEYSCEVCAKDSIKPENKDCKTETATYVPRVTCELGEQTVKFLNGVWNIYECDGTDFVWIDKCKEGELVRLNTMTGEYECYLPTECTIDADCPAHYKCIGGICQIPACETDEDCPPGKVCRLNKCVEAGDCEAIRDTCLERCGVFDIFCVVGCHLGHVWCVIVRFVTTMLMWVGLIVVIVIALIIILKVVLKKTPMEYMPRIFERGVRPAYERGVRRPYEWGREKYRRWREGY